LYSDGITTKALSFSFYRGYKTCEVNQIYPKGIPFTAEGWKTFYKVGKKIGFVELS
jgi:hypothetical protein